MSTANAPPVTPEDLLAMPDGNRYELVNGELKELDVSQESSWIAGKVIRVLGEFAEDAQLGWVFPEGTSYQCFPWDPMQVRKPDASFIVRERLPSGPTGRGHTKIAPDLAVEVISPNDRAYEVESKLADYREAGVVTIWIVYPEQRTIIVHRQGQPSSSQIFRENDQLTGDGPLADFACRVGDLFPPVDTTAKR